MSILDNSGFLPECKTILKTITSFDDIKKEQELMRDENACYSVLTLITHFINSWGLTKDNTFNKLFKNHPIFDKMKITNENDPTNYLVHEIIACSEIQSVDFKIVKDFFLDIANYLQFLMLCKVYNQQNATPKTGYEKDLKKAQKLIDGLNELVKEKSFENEEYNKKIYALDKILTEFDEKQKKLALDYEI